MTARLTLKTHATLVDRMANTLGLDLEEVMMEGRMTFDQLGDAVLSCTGCTQPEACGRWLDAQTETVHDTPGYCRNSDLFDRLKAGKSA